MLWIDAPCVYLIDSESNTVELSASVLEVRATKPTQRSLVALPRGLITYDADANSIWYRGNGPLTNGTPVTLHGGRGKNRHADVCHSKEQFTAHYIGLDEGALRRWDLLRSMSTTTQPPGPDPFVGMWDYNPANEFHVAQGLGVLWIEPPCVYLIDSESNESELSSAEIEARAADPAARTLVTLPRGFVTYDAETNSIRYEDHGPLANGDPVSLTGGGGGTNRHEDICPSDGSFTASHIGLDEGALRRWDLLRSMSTTTQPHEPDPFVGMWDYNPANQGPAALGVGVLWIEAPCVYLVQSELNERELSFAEIEARAADPATRSLIGLPRGLITYDAETNSIWYEDHGPLTNGDPVRLGGGGGRNRHADVCPSHGRMGASHIHLDDRALRRWDLMRSLTTATLAPTEHGSDEP